MGGHGEERFRVDVVVFVDRAIALLVGAVNTFGFLGVPGLFSSEQDGSPFDAKFKTFEMALF